MSENNIPLSTRMRPRTFDEVVGQNHLTGDSAPLQKLMEQRQLPSLLLWGPPGSGKTTIARLLAVTTGMRLETISAVTSGMKELREVIQRARQSRGQGNGPSLFSEQKKQGSILLFVDEIHRWNKAQQDALLPHVEEGLITLIGATTENPAFEIISALRSRCWLLQLEPLDVPALVALCQSALTNADRGLGVRELTATADALALIAEASMGDGRRCLSLLERAASTVPDKGSINTEVVKQVAGTHDTLHDKGGDQHFDILSAFIKSMRGSDPDASLYWMARMIQGGEDPMLIARRMVVFASEDIGNADPRALSLAVSTMQAVHMIGLPEARIPLGQTCAYLATAPKSNAAYKAIEKALRVVRSSPPRPVPHHLRNAPTELAKSLGHGSEYQYPHDHPYHIVSQDHFPTEIQDRMFYQPTLQGAEQGISKRMEWISNELKKRGDTTKK